MPEKWTKRKRANGGGAHRTTWGERKRGRCRIQSGGMNIQTSGIQCQKNGRRGNAPTEVARTGHRGQKGGEDNPTPALPSREGEGDKAAFPIRQSWRIQKKGKCRTGGITPPRPSPQGEGERREEEGRGEGNRRNTGENRTYTGNRKQDTGS